MNQRVEDLFGAKSTCLIHQVKEWAEIFTGFETRNKYQILDHNQSKIGYCAEVGKGFLKILQRIFLRVHRPMDIQVWNQAREEVLRCKRPFYWFFSDMEVFDSENKLLGTAHRKFAFITKVYEICDSQGILFATIKSPIWKLWQFPIRSTAGVEIGMINKNWGGLLKEIFTDADKFQVSFPGDFDSSKKAVLFCTAITIDLDYFEDNNRNQTAFGSN